MRAAESEATDLLLRHLDYVPISWGAAKLAGTLLLPLTT